MIPLYKAIVSLPTPETERLRGDQNEVFKILNGYENIESREFSWNPCFRGS